MSNKTGKLVMLILAGILVFSLMSISAFAQTEEIAEEIAEEIPAEEGEAVLMSDDAANVTYDILKDQTWTMENIGLTANEISLYDTVDYVMYYKDGSIKEYKSGSYITKISVPAGGRFSMTAWNDMDVTLADDYFIVEEIATPVMKHVVINVGDCYRITNTEAVPYELRGSSGYFDYILYDTEGNIVEYDDYAYTANKSIPAGYSIELTRVNNEDYPLCLLYDKFEVQKKDFPSMRRITLYKGESYTFKNVGGVDYCLRGTTNYYDYILYDMNGNMVEYAANAHLEDKIISAGYSIKLVQSDHRSAALCFPAEKFDVQKNDTPVMERVTIYKGETFTFTNNGDDEYHLMGNVSYYDYILYDPDGNVVEYGEYRNIDGIAIPVGYSLKVTQMYHEQGTIYVLYGKVNIEKNDLPVMTRVTMYRGEIYTFNNISDEEYRFMGSLSYYDYVLYDPDGNIVQYAENSYIDSLAVPAGYSLKLVQSYHQNATVCMLRGKFTYSKDEMPAFIRINGYRGETYSFTNISSGKAKIDANFYADYIIYYPNGSIKETVTDGYISDLELSSGNKITITINSDEGYIAAPYELFDVEYGTLVNEYYTFGHGKTYLITNLGETEKTIFLNGGGTYNYVIYDAHEGIVEEGLHHEREIIIPVGGRAYVEPFALAQNSFILDDELEISEKDETLYDVIYAKPNQTFAIKNIGVRDNTIYYDGLSVDYIIYNADGSSLEYDSFEINNTFCVPANGYIRITTYGGDTAIYFLREFFSYEEETSDIFRKDIIGRNETYKFKNTTDIDMTLLTSPGKMDYVIYNADDSVYEEELQINTSDFVVPPQSTIVITPTHDNITVSSLKGVFDVSERSYPVFKKIVVGIYEETLFTNISNIDRNIYAISQDVFTYSTFDSALNLQEEKEYEYLDYITVPASGTAKVKANLDEMIFAGLYECFSDEDLSVKVTGISLSAEKLTLAPGKQSIIRATISPDDATNKTVTWQSSDKSVATVAQTGKITAKAIGTAIITATTVDGEFTASCVVTVTDGTLPPEPEVTTGDANGDGEVDFADAIVVLKHDAGVSELTGDNLKAADTNADGEVDFADAILILKYDCGLISSFN